MEGSHTVLEQKIVQECVGFFDADLLHTEFSLKQVGFAVWGGRRSRLCFARVNSLRSENTADFFRAQQSYGNETEGCLAGTVG